jgi:hypothetical protein
MQLGALARGFDNGLGAEPSRGLGFGSRQAVALELIHQIVEVTLELEEHATDAAWRDPRAPELFADRREPPFTHFAAPPGSPRRP